MRWTLKDCLKNCSMALKKMPGKRGKWVRDWPGQVSVCVCVPFCICVKAVIPLQSALLVFTDVDHSQSNPVDHRRHQSTHDQQRESR